MIQARRLLLLFLLFCAGNQQAAELRGLLILGHEVRSLQLCGEERVFWLHIPADQRQQLESTYHRLAAKPYEPLYTEIEGEFSEQAASGFAVDYDGILEIRGVRSLSRDGVETCVAELPATHIDPAVAEHAQTYVFLCDAEPPVTVRTTLTRAWVFRPDETLMLPAERVEKGMKYADESFEVLIDGQQAQMGKPGSGLMRCRNDRRRAVWEHAKLNGADFRAVGNEPGWTLEIRNGSRIVLVADYGSSRVELPLPQPRVNQEAQSTRWDAGELVLDVFGSPCRDSMSGESFESTVEVVWGKRLLRGCGRALH